MAAREMIEIILKAEDQASQVFKQNENNVKRFGDAAKQANQKASQASQSYAQKLEETRKKLPEMTKHLKDVGQNGSKSFKQLSQSQQDNIVKFNMLDKETQQVLQQMSRMKGLSSNLVPGASKALQEFHSLDNVTKTWAGSLDYSKSKLQLLGTSTDGLRGKIQVVGNAIPTYLGSKWDGLKSKVSGFGNFIKSNLSSALSTVRSKIDSLGSAFSGLGGVVSSVLGGITLKGLSDMTIGASISRDRIHSLSNALLQADTTMVKLNGTSVSLWDKMDADTNSSLVSLDQLAQSLSVVKQMTGATGDQLNNMEGIVLNLGQRAILMGKEGEDAMTVMQAAGKGLNGEFEILQENFGITKDKLEELGWDGSAQDIEGYTAALQKALDQSGDVSDMMDTTHGKLTSLKKMWSVAGRSIGDDFKPYLDQALTSLLSFLDADSDGALDQRGKKWMQYAYGAIAVASGFATLAPSIAPALSVLGSLAGATKSALVFLGLMTGAQDALTISTLSNTIAEKANAIAKGTHAAATVAASTASKGFLSSVLALNVALLANPITWVVIALIALAAAVYEVGKYFGWWNDIPSMLSAVWSGVNRLWNAFINHPDVQAALQAIGSGLSWLGGQIMGAIKSVLQFFNVSTGDNWDVVSTIIHGIGDAWNGLKSVIGTVVGVFQAIYNAALPIGQGIYNALKPIVCILLGCSPGIVPALQKVQEVFGSVWNTIAGFIGGVITTIVTAIQPIVDILSAIVNFYLSSFIYAWQTLTMVFNIVSTAVNVLINIFSLFLSGQINLQTMLTMVWTTLSQMFALVLTTIINRVRSWASNLLSRAISAGRGFVNGVIRFVSGLPGRFGSYLTSVIGRIASAGASWISTGISKASAMVTGIISNVSQLPGKVYTEFMNIGSRMLSAGSDLVNKAKEIGKNIVDGLLGAMGIHSPGIIQEKVVLEFVNMVGRVGSKIKSAYDTAKSMGEAIVEGFGNPTLETNTENMLPNEDALKTSIGVQAELSHQVSDVPSTTATMDTSGVDTANTDVIGSYDNLALMAGSALQSMVDQDKLAYDTIRNNDFNTLSQMSLNLQQKMGFMSNNVASSMNNIVSKNRSSMNTVNNTTKSHLNSIVSKTKSANNQMIKSWGVMKEGIIKAANQIRSDSTDHFKKLSNTIGDFYGKLKNPSRWGAGGPSAGSPHTNKSLVRNRNGFGKITSAIQNAQLPKYLSLNQIRNNPLIQSSNFGDYITKDKKNNRFSVSDLVKYGAITLLGTGAGAYDNIPSPNIKLIKDTSNEWDMDGPLVGKFPTSHGFKVKDFLTGVPQIGFDEFRSIAEDVYGQTKYEFYYDDDHHGNWVNAFNAGSMNCKHGAESIIALASVFGLSGGMVHGHWNEYGHYWANIAGHKMDVTGWQQRRTWTPSASAGPAPRSIGFKDVIQQLIDILKDDPDDSHNPSSNIIGSNSNESSLKGEFTIIHDFKNLPSGVTAEEVAKIVENSATNDNFVKKLVKYVRFQELDAKEKLKLERRANRAKGV